MADGLVSEEGSGSNGDEGASVRDLLGYHDASGGQVTLSGLVFLGILKAVSGFRKFRRSLTPGRNDDSSRV